MTIHGMFERQAALTPEATALIFEDQRYSYAELNRRANQLAYHLCDLGAGPETLVGICARRSPDMIAGMLGILKAGGAYVALDPAYPKVRLAFMIEDADMPIVLTQEELADSLPVTKAKVICLDRALPVVQSAAKPTAAVAQHNLAYILYTSGSTGRPKGVAIEHNSVVVFLNWAHSVFPIEELAGTLAGTSICFDLSVFEIFVPLTCGGAVILAESAVALPTLPARDEVTLINTVPSAMSALINVGGVPPNVRVVNLAGEPLPNKLVQDIYALGHVEKVYNLYGPSEDTTYSTFVLCERGAMTNPTIGRPIDHTQVHIVDEKLRLVPDGASGELCLSGEGLARGYLKRPDLTEAKFLANPFGPGRIYRTGDLARILPDGNIEFQGRMDYQVKVRGYRIELGEIETALEQHPAVDRAVVLALPDLQGELQLVAHLTAKAAAMETLAHTGDAHEHLTLWQNVYEETYRQSPAPEDPTFNTSGWLSSYTGQPFDTAEMREWLAQTVERILSLQPRNVLEIGCGTGMLLARVAPHCESYVGLDFSQTALDHIRSMRKMVPGLDRVTLYERAADQLEDFESGSFDTIVINSVVQHFPDADYLIRVLTDAVRLVKAGGHILIGDVLNLALLETFHTSVQLFRAADTDTSLELKRHIRQHVSQERDLMVAPGFFLALAQQVPAITHVRILPKRGRYHNQLTRFRYEAVLHVASPMESARDLSWLDWQRSRLTLPELRRRLAATLPETLAIRNIPNARLEEEVAALPWLREAGPAETVAELRRYIARETRRGIEPEDLLGLGQELRYRVELSWLNADPSGGFDVVFTREDNASPPAWFAYDWQERRPCRDYVNHPQRAKLNRELIPQVRHFLQDKLPHYMMPAVFNVLDKLPLSQTGKIDRRALAQLPVTLAPPDEARTVAHNPLEALLVRLWADALNLNYVELDDDFFEMGGNSLKAMALMHNLQKRFAHPFRPANLMQAPSVAQFAAYLQQTWPDVPKRMAAAASAAPELVAVEHGEL